MHRTARAPRAGSRYRSIALLVLVLLLAPGASQAVPSFARQTKLKCNACHTQFPELNAFGREFKLNGYALRGIEGLESKRPGGSKDLDLPIVPLLGVMFQASLTTTQKAQTDPTGIATVGPPQNQTVQLPQQMSLFLAGEFADHLGGFVQVTYSPDSGTFGLDNTDIRYADHFDLDEKPVVYGVTLNNNPTAQDLWNSTPAWRFPYAQSAVAPTPAAAPLLEGGLAQRVAGLTAYAMWNDLLYVEGGAYRSAPQGFGGGVLHGGNASDVISGAAPYWRVALQQQWENQYFMIGAFGMLANVYPGSASAALPNLLAPTPLRGVKDRFNDAGVDANYQLGLGEDSLSLHASWIHESRSLNATFEGGGSLTDSLPLDSFRLAATYHLGTLWGFTVAPFLTQGRADPLFYPMAPITGSRTGKPDSSGVTFEIDLNRWQNVRLAAQYTAYFEFNGASSDYDGFGRRASANNTFYLLGWVTY